MPKTTETSPNVKSELPESDYQPGQLDLEMFSSGVMTWLDVLREGQQRWNSLQEQQRWLAARMSLTTKYVSGAIRGKKKLGRGALVLLLSALGQELGDRWCVADALDVAMGLGEDWHSVVRIAIREYAREYQDHAINVLDIEAVQASMTNPEVGAFLKWWVEGKPPERPPLPEVKRPAFYVERECVDGLIQILVFLEDYQRARYQGIILWGAAGFGKSTLAAALAEDEYVQDVFRDGILWLDAQRGKPEKWAERVGGLLNLNRESNESWVDWWQRWASQAGRRLLLIVDDMTATNEWNSILTGLGPQVVVLVTAQNVTDAEGVLTNCLGTDRIVDIHVGGLTSAEGIELAETVLARDLQAEEVACVEQLGQQLGWHPEALRLAVLNGNRAGWQGLMESIQRGSLDERIQILVQRQFMQMGDTWRGWLDELLGQMRVEAGFSLPYGVVAWGVSPAETEHRLHLLEGTGLVEQIEGVTFLGEDETWWRVTPVVYRTMCQPGKKNIWRKIKVIFRSGFRAGRLKDVLKYRPRRWHPTWGIRAVLMLCMMVNFLIELVGAFLWFVGCRRLETRWVSLGEWLFVTWGGERLKRDWEQGGVLEQPPLELWVLGDNHLFASYVTVAFGLVVLGLVMFGKYAEWIEPWAWYTGVMVLLAVVMVLLAVVMVLLVLALFWSIAWQLWIMYLLGVKTVWLRVVIRLLYLLGIEDAQRDWDVTTDENEQSKRV